MKHFSYLLLTVILSFFNTYLRADNFVFHSSLAIESVDVASVPSATATEWSLFQDTTIEFYAEFAPGTQSKWSNNSNVRSYEAVDTLMRVIGGNYDGDHSWMNQHIFGEIFVLGTAGNSYLRFGFYDISFNTGSVFTKIGAPKFTSNSNLYTYDTIDDLVSILKPTSVINPTITYNDYFLADYDTSDEVSYSQVNISHFSGDIYSNTTIAEIIPEPSTFSLALSIAAILVIAMRRHLNCAE
ncbi:MAG: hypothetical protein CL815_04875 [Coraliomargarita sp.]|nr:hypothetical protein [Coraliomargarita sp.]